MARCALTTRQTMKPSGINHCLADAGVWLAYGCAKAIASCHADCLVGQTQTDRRERRSMKPVADVWSRQRLQSCLIDGRGACLEQAVVDSHRDVSIPCAFDVFNSIWRFTSVILASPCCHGVVHCAVVNSCKRSRQDGILLLLLFFNNNNNHNNNNTFLAE